LVTQSASDQYALLDGEHEDLPASGLLHTGACSKNSHPYTLNLTQADFIAATVIELGRSG
jgi:hypothetical protein